MSSFLNRHIGPSPTETQSMLNLLGFGNLEEMVGHIVPKNIRSSHPFKNLDPAQSETEWLKHIANLLKKNKINQSLIGMGFYGTITPAVIQRNILENPAWYTAYTPYQPEISQGRLEALLNFQTMITDLTALDISNASMLDEGTAAAEAMSMAYNLQKKGTESNRFLVDPGLHPHVIEVLKTRSEPLGLQMILSSALNFDFSEKVFAVFVSYPTTEGSIENYEDLARQIHLHNAFLIADVDLLSLTLLKPPGEWGADIVVGNTQRFGVPMGYGGPHAAFLATKDEFKRLMPGRLVGVSKDTHGSPALRLALQTREQHIRREKATSNICTAQVLLANMASMYAVYHGPQGLKNLALEIHHLTHTLAENLKLLGRKVRHQNYFDTLVIETPKDGAQVLQKALELGINLRDYPQNSSISSTSKSVEAIGLSLDELCNTDTLEKILAAFDSLNSTNKAESKNTFTPQDSLLASVPHSLHRTSSFMEHPVFNRHHTEHGLTRYIFALQNKDLSLVHSMIPLGSCTMKLNATAELMPVSWPEISQLHPFVPLDQAQGVIQMIQELETKLAEITGYDAISLQPNGGSQGEFAGLLVIRKYFLSRNEGHRTICLIPSSAHGTNPASAVMAGFQVVVVNCDNKGNIDLEDLKIKAEKHAQNLGALMITYPSTHGVFEESVVEICNLIHKQGGQVYMDGANMNALVGLCRPGEFGPDVGHLNLHKTFAIPHGGGGPGVGPIGVKKHLQAFLPGHKQAPVNDSPQAVTATTSGPWGSASILPISLGYINMLGFEGLRRSTQISLLNANYISKRLANYYPTLYTGREGLVAHECILDLNPLKKLSGVDVTDVAKRLMDFGFHAPTMSWPVIGTLMIEPTESESKEELDRFIDAMIQIHKEAMLIANGSINPENNPLKNAPHTSFSLLTTEWKHPYSREEAAFPLPWVKKNKFWPAVGRIDSVYGDRNLVCACPPLSDYES